MNLVVPTNPLQNQMLCDWAARELRQEAFDRAQAIGFMDGNVLIAAVVLHDHAPPNVMLSWVFKSPRFFSRTVIRIVFEWAFSQMGVERVTGLVDKRNKRARKLNERLGMKLEGVLRKASPEGRDLFVYGMLREEAEALLERINGKAKQS